jgi:hypothetical protein
MAKDELPEADVAIAYRAPGTKYISEVTAVVYWASEPYQPRFSYSDADYGDRDKDYIQSSTFVYTLEFDGAKRLIGGEWGTLSELAVAESPDFLFGYRKAAEPILPRYGSSAYLRKAYQTIISKVHRCSLQDQAGGHVTLKVPSPWGQDREESFSYVECKL